MNVRFSQVSGVLKSTCVDEGLDRRRKKVLFLVVGGCLAWSNVAGGQGGYHVNAEGSGKEALASDHRIAQNQPLVSISLRDSTLRYIVRALGKQAGRSVIINDSDPRFSKRITVEIRKMKVMEAFATILHETGLVAVLSADQKTIVITAPQLNEAQHQTQATGSLVGQILDSASREGIKGVAVILQGTKLSAVSNAKGEFHLSPIPVGEQTISFKMLGYTSVTRTVRIEDNKRTVLQVALRQMANMLAGVVTTATGEQRKVEVGHSIVSINVDSLRQVAPIMSVTDLLESRVPGMTIQRTSGTPGDPARIRLRGTGSIYENNDPIIVVDGVRMYSQQSDSRNVNSTGSGNQARSYATPSPLDQIDPSMIEKIEVLKGPSASALYGSDAANGVIVITTKRGQAGPPVWNASLDAGVSYQPGSWPTSTYQWVTPFVGGPPTRCIGFCGDAQIDSVRHFQALNDPYLTVLGRGSVFRPTVNVSGGSQTMMYNLSATLGRERGILKLPKIEEERYLRYQQQPAPAWMRRPDLLETRGAHGQFTINLTPNTRVTASTILNQSVQHRTSMSASELSAISELQGRWIDLSQLDERPILGNPYERVTTDILNLQNSVQLTARPVSWLPITGTFGMNSMITNTEMQIGRGLLTTSDSGGVQRGEARGSSELTWTVFSQIPIWDRISMTAGLNYNRGRTNDLAGAFFGIPLGVTDPSVGQDTARTQFRRSSSERVSFGWFVEPRMVLSQRFFLTPGFRLDNNGLSGRNAKFNGLPKMNFSWLVSDEGFFPWKEKLQMVRLRTAFGVSGVQPSPDELHRQYTPRIFNPFGGQEPLYGETLELSTLGNSRLRPERVRELEGGIDIELWQSRLRLDLTHWRKSRVDAIISNNFASSVDGGGIQRMNVGDLQNTGTEISLFAQLVERRNLSFNVNINFNRQQSLVRRLNACSDVLCARNLSSGHHNYRVGFPMDGIWKTPVLGYHDLDGNGWISEPEIALGPQIFLGARNPAYQLGIHPIMNLLGGRFSIAASFSYLSGQIQTLGFPITESLWGPSTPPFATNIVFGSEGFDRQVAFLLYPLISDIGYSQKVNVTRWQDFSVSVHLSPTLVRRLKARNASLSLQGKNLGLWTNYIGVDPNVNSALSGHGLQDSGQQPQPRVWLLKLMMGY